MRNISFSYTTQQFLDGSKDVTRRNGWWFLEHNDLLMGCEKCMGLKPGEKIHRLGPIRVVRPRPERLGEITMEEVVREGFPDWTPRIFIDFFCSTHKAVTPNSIINRIEFVHVTLENPWG